MWQHKTNADIITYCKSSKESILIVQEGVIGEQKNPSTIVDHGKGRSHDDFVRLKKQQKQSIVNNKRTTKSCFQIKVDGGDSGDS